MSERMDEKRLKQIQESLEPENLLGDAVRPMHFDRDGAPISMEEWATAMENMELKRVAWDALPEGGRLSTVWLGLDHGWGDGPPLIFETMAFPEERYSIQERYATLQEALDGHARILKELTEPAS